MLLSAETMEPAVLTGLHRWSLGRLPAPSSARARVTGPSRGRAGNQAQGSSLKGDTGQANRNVVDWELKESWKREMLFSIELTTITQ